MEFKIEPLVGCNFLLFGEKRENLRNMLDNKYDRQLRQVEDYIGMLQVNEKID